MTPEVRDPKVHHQTARGARLALARKEISQESYRAVLAGELSLTEAREFWRDRGPHDTGQASSGREGATERPPEDRERPQESTSACLCGCGETTRGGRFKPGHDARLHGELKRNLEKDPLLRNERFSHEQKAYAKERKLI